MTDAPKHTGIRTFEIVQYVSGWMEGGMDDWPANVQDAILQALEIKSKQVELPLAIVHTRCDVDPDEPEGSPRRFYVHIVASEIVAADEREVKRLLQ